MNQQDLNVFKLYIEILADIQLENKDEEDV